MTRPDNLTCRLYLDSGDPHETREVKQELGFLDGQTTNPTLVAKHPEAKKRLLVGKLFSKQEIYGFYKEVIQEISPLVTESVSIEVYADHTTAAEEMVVQGKEMNTWIPNAHIKLPITTAGLQAARELVNEGVRVNMTLVFTQAQAAAVHAATVGAQIGQVYLSPFIGRLDDIGDNGLDLIHHVLAMYREQGSHVEVLTASVRSLEHVVSSVELMTDVITIPRAYITEWVAAGMPLAHSHQYTPNLKPIVREFYQLTDAWETFDIHHELTDKGIQRFSDDWNALIFS